MPERILQLTDLHLMSDPAAKLRGIPTWDSFRDVIKFIRHGNGQFDAVIVTGDLAHDEQPRTYEMLRDELHDYLDVCHLLPGNHDDRQAMRNAFPALFVEPSPFLVFSVRIGGWRVIGLDSQVPGEVHGSITTEQLGWLSGQLDTFADEPTIVFMHHPPFLVDSVWLDQIGLQSPERLIDLLSRRRNVRVICTGHVHHEFHRTVAGMECFTTPSTGVQFCPGREQPEYDVVAPGFRVLTLTDTDFRTEVVRLPEVNYVPDPPDDC